MSSDDDPEGGFASEPSKRQRVTRTRYSPNALMLLGEQSAEGRLRFHQVLAQTTAAEFKVTGNAVYAWGAIQACLAPEIDPLSLPPEVRRYLHDAAKGIVDAATQQHEAFAGSVLRALAFAGKQGSSRAREYAKLQGEDYLIGIYNALKQRHGSAKAEELLSGAMRIDTARVRARLRDARRTRASVRRELLGDAGAKLALSAKLPLGAPLPRGIPGRAAA